MRLESQILRTPEVSDAATNAPVSRNGQCFLMPSTATQSTGVGTDLCMVAGTAAGKTKVSTKQRRLTVTGDTQDVQVVSAFVNVCVNVFR